jgi:hypothetical protein
MKALIYTFALGLLAVLHAEAQPFGIELKHTLNQVNCLSLAESPDGRFALANKRFGIGLYRLDRTAQGYKMGAELFTGDQKFPQHLAIGTGHVLVAFADRSMKLYALEGAGMKEVQLITDLDEIPQYMQYSARRKAFVLADGSHTWIFALEGDEVKLVHQSEEGGLLQMNEAGDRFLVGEKYYELGADLKPRLVQDLSALKFRRLDAGRIDAAALDAEGKLLAINDAYYLALCRFNGKEWTVLYEREIPEELSALCFSTDGRYLFGGDDHSDRTVITVWKLSEADTLETIEQLKGFEDGIEQIAVSRDGMYLLTGTNDVFSCFALKGVKGRRKVEPGAQPVAREEPRPQPKPAPQKEKPAVALQLIWMYPNPDLLRDKPLSTEDGQIEIQLKVIGPAGLKPADIRILINGKPVQEAKFGEVALLPAEAQPGEYTLVKRVPLQSGLNRIEAEARGAKTLRAAEVMYRTGKPALHVLSIGTSLDLQFPKKDAEDFAALFRGQDKQDGLFSRVDVKTLIGKDASTNAIKEAVEYYRYAYKQGSIRSGDIILVFLSSHGFMYQNRFRIQGDDYKDMFKETYSVAYDEIISRLDELDCKKVIFLDACFSGGAKADAGEIAEAIEVLNRQKTGTATFSSCSRDEYSYEDAAWNNGAFTRALLDACRKGAADADRNGIITLGELYSYVRAEVPRMVMEVKQKSQTPTMPVQDLLQQTPIFLKE